MIFDRWGNPLGDLPYVIKAIRTRATDATDTLDITTIGEINKDERIAFKDSMGRWAEYLCQSTQTARAAGMPVTVAYCTGSIAELSRTYIEDKRNRNANAKACLAKALEGTRWAVGTVETGTITGTANLAFYHCTALDAIQKTADTYGLEVQTEYQPDPTGNQIGRRIIHLVEHRGSTNTKKRFEYGKDLTQIKRDIDAGDVITRLYGWGKGIEQTNEEGEATGGYSRKISFADVNNGKPYVQDDQALADWGIVGADGTRHHSEASVDFPDCEDPKELLALTKNALKTRTTPVVSYTADVTALGQAGYDPEGADVGDSVQIIDTSFTNPLRLEGRILQIEEDLAGSLADTKITLGNIRQSYTQRLAAQQQALDKLVSNSGAWNSAAGGTGPYMKDLIDRINQIMNATGGYTYLKPGQGIYVYNKPEDQNPTQCIHIGGGYWRIADHKKANGDWDFRSLANGKGIFADAIYTGLLSDAEGYNSWNLDTGDFKLSARTTVGGKTVDAIAGDSSSAALAEAKKYADQMKRESDQTDLDNLAAAKDYAQAKAEEARKNALASASTDATNKANAALEAAKKAAQAYVDALDESLGQKSVFDRLTNYGKTQGLFMENGNLYANASYVKSGVLDANLVKAGILTDKRGLQYWDMTTGEFRLAGTSTIAGNKASDLATTTAAQRLTSEAEAAAKKYADGIGSDTLTSAKADAASKANAAQSAAAADATKKANDAEANAKKAASTDATNKANAALEAAKSYADNTATSHVNTFEKALTQQYIFNKLTNNGQLQGLYMSGGLLYVNATYLRSGIISGARSYWNLDSGQFVMTDANGRRTVLLDGDGNSNLLTGTFQTALSGSSVRISPTFSQTEIGGGDEITGPGIQFYHATASNQHPYIAVESSTKQEGEVSTLTFNGGHRGKGDPGGWLRIGERKDSDNTTKIATALMMAKANYRSTTSAGSSVSLKSSSGKCNATMMAYDSNGSVGVEADIFTGYLYLGGFLGSWAGQRGTLITHEVEGSHHIAPFMTTTFRLTFTPPKYGRYKGLGTVNCADQNASISSTPCNETSSEYTVMIRSMPASVGGYNLFPSGGTNYWVTGFAYLVK
jgi:phage minor structural protein